MQNIPFIFNKDDYEEMMWFVDESWVRIYKVVLSSDENNWYVYLKPDHDDNDEEED